LKPPATWQDIANKVVEFLGTPGTVLFAGAGVGQRAGLPSWAEYLDHLASVAQTHDPNIAAAIRDRIKANRLADAAGLFKLCQMSEADKYRALAEPFLPGRYDPKYLKPLVALPFNAIVTTNYDKSLLDAWAGVHQTAPDTAELFEPTMKAAIHWPDPFVARVHGRAELPETIVVSSDDFKKIQANDDYIEFLMNIFRFRRCLIIGYSFLDPAITNVLVYITRSSAKGVQPTHLALVPEGSDELAAGLAELSVETLLYAKSTDPANPHEALWSGISQAATRLSGKEATTHFPLPLEPARHLLAASYVRARMGPQFTALRELVIEGAIMSLLSDALPNGLTEGQIAQEIHNCMALTLDEARTVVTPPLAALVRSRICRREGDQLYGTPTKNTLKRDIDELARAAMQRLQLRRGGRTTDESTIPDSVPALLHDLLEYAILWRGWDLGAELAGAPVHPDLWTILIDYLDAHATTIRPALRFDMASASLDLLTRPTNKEADMLAPIGRLAYATYVILQHARGPLLHRRILPEAIYLDTSVAMPYIVEGHPLRPAYVDALDAWRAACLASGIEPRLMLADVFMNEILAHRRRALEIVADASLENPEKLGRHILFFGAEYTNVFVGAYASWVGRLSKNAIPFQEWLAKYAPYTNRDDLSAYLSHHGIDPVALQFDSKGTELLHSTLAALRTAYQRDERSRFDPKFDVLIADEAKQLTQLTIELRQGRRTLFVTADRRLRRLSVGHALGYAGAATISHIGLVQLVDLLVGMKADSPSISRLIWSLHSNDHNVTLRNFLITIALKRQEEAIVLSLPSILDNVVASAVDDAAHEKLRFWSRVPEQQARMARFLDRVEDQFFDEMEAAVAKFRRELND